MTFQELLKQPEGKTLEFKRDLSSLRPVLRTLVAFANTADGVLVVGCLRAVIRRLNGAIPGEASACAIHADRRAGILHDRMGQISIRGQGTP